jgi:hypothetical protein
MTTPTNYTVHLPNGKVLSQDRTVAEAAYLILTYNGQNSEIRKQGSFYTLWTKGRNESSFQKTTCYASNCTRAEAVAEINQQVVDHSCNWIGACYAIAED